ncbi:hypothetical protein niasHS_012252 [Heterodera schachtii]|uniref:non-specific serine/threonine protein kinase n=1 Tax=Heterodera schachtii TaxID=97005 RepID=A0ABD2IJ70_HETSC
MARTKKGRVSRFRGITKRNPGIEHHGKSIIEIDCCDATQIQKLKQCLDRDENDNLSNQFIMSNDETPVKIDEANKKPFKRAPHNKKKEVKKIDFDVVNSDEGHQPKANKRKRGKKEEARVHPELEVYLEAEKNRLETILVDAADYELKCEDVPREKRQYLEPANQTSTCTTIAEMSSRDLFWEDSPLVGHQSQVKKSRWKPPPTPPMDIQQQKEQSPPSPLQQSPTVPTAMSPVASPQQRQSMLTAASSVASSPSPSPPPPPLNMCQKINEDSSKMDQEELGFALEFYAKNESKYPNENIGCFSQNTPFFAQNPTLATRHQPPPRPPPVTNNVIHSMNDFGSQQQQAIMAYSPVVDTHPFVPSPPQRFLGASLGGGVQPPSKPSIAHQSQVMNSRGKPPPPPTPPTVIQQQKEQSPPAPPQQRPPLPTAACSVASLQQRQSVLTVASSVASPPPPPPLFQSKTSLSDNSLPSTSTESKTSSVDPTMFSKPSIAHQSQVMNSRGKPPPPPTPPTVIHQQKEQIPPVSTAASSVASPQQIQSVLTTASLVASPPPPPPLFQSKPTLPDNSLPSTSTESKTSSVDPTNNKRSDLLQQIQQGTKLKKVGPPSTERTPVPTNAPTLRDNMMEQIKQGTTLKHVDQSDVENSRCSAGGSVQEIGMLTGALAIALEEQSRHAMCSIENSALASPTPSTSMSSTTFSTSALSPLKLQFKSLDKALPTNSWESELDAFLELCGQSAVFSWNEFEDSTCSFDKWSKIGEGAFGEVFKGLLENAFIALKVIPFAVNEEQCSKLVNGDYLKPAKFIFNELFITNELTKLSEDTGSGFVTPSFTQLRMSKIVRGCFPCKLLKAWDAFKKAKPELSENERPDIYADEGLHFVVIGLSYGGKDLEAYTIKNGRECYSIFHQIALSLAIAEDVLEFEHRDLHAGNILVEQCPANEKIRYMYRGEQIDVVSNGVRASIIDFSISRLKKKGVLFFVDLSQDTGLFEQNGVSDGGDYQYDVYRMMKAAVSENWASFWPQTNVFWMGYAAKKLFNNRFIRAKRKEAIENLFSNFENNFETIHDFIVHPNFLSVFTEFTSE